MYELEGRVRHDLIGPGAVNAAHKAHRVLGPNGIRIILYCCCHMTIFKRIKIYEKNNITRTHNAGAY